MIRRFSAYGFLKNQRYFEPFLILLLLDKGLDFFAIGLLVAVREVTVNLTEIASGALADVYGRRASMVASFLAYIGSFLAFGLAEHVVVLGLAMVMYGIGDAFRTGTHKAMIFTWLRLEGRSDEKTEVYGYTRSWSKIGSAVGVVIGTILVFALDRYEPAFFLAIVPYLFNIANVATYPAALDARGGETASLAAFWRRLRQGIRTSWEKKPLRSLLVESMAFEGSFAVAKDYLQPVLKALVLGAAVFAFTQNLGESQRVALLVGPVYVILFLLSAWASRHAGSLARRVGDERSASKVLWFVFAAAFGTLLVASLGGLTGVLVAVFVLLFVLQNFWRPILVSRVDEHTSDEDQATVLSVEHQAKTVAAMFLAPTVGWAVDSTGSFWPVAAAGLVAYAAAAGTRTLWSDR